MNALRSLKALGRPFSVYAAAAVFGALLPCAGAAAPLKLHTNQEMIDDLLRPNDLDIKNPDAVFAAVFEQLAPKVTVYPTESYYYFTFQLNGINYAGNIRFDAADQFDGKVHFAYANEYAYWRKPLDPVYKKMGPDDGVKVEQSQQVPLQNRVQGQDGRIRASRPVERQAGARNAPRRRNLPRPVMGRVRRSVLPDLQQDGEGLPLPAERNAQSGPVRAFVSSLRLSRVGNRTSFVFYKDKLLDRKILMGDFIGHTMLNDYFDGPFDQLPDNYVQGNALLDAILEVEPGLKGEKADRYGADPTGEFRYGITSYKYYAHIGDLKPIVDCAEKNSDPAVYYKCFDATKSNEEEEQKGDPDFLSQKPAEGKPDEPAPAAKEAK